MLINDTFARRMKGKVISNKAFVQQPIVFFGATVSKWDEKEKRLVSLYTKQAHIIRQWMARIPKITVITGWKRTGKTAIGAYIGACWMTGQCNETWPGAKAMGITQGRKFTRKINGERIGLIAGRSFEHVDAVLLREYQSLIPPAFINRWYKKGTHSISIKDYNGWYARCHIRTYDQPLDHWKGNYFQFEHLDEEPPIEKMNESLERAKTTRGRILITVAIDDADVSWLPEACLNPLKFFGTTDFMHFKLGVEDVPDDIYPSEEKQATYAKYDGTPLELAVRKGEFAYVSGRWWKEFDREIHVIKTFTPPAHWKRYRFIDAGYSAPTACAWVAVHDKEPIIFIYREFYKSGLIIDKRCEEIIAMSGNRRRREEGIWMEEETGEKYEMTQLDYHEFRTDNVTGDGLDFEWVKSGLSVQPSTTLGQEDRRELVNKWLWVDLKEHHFITHKPGAPRLYVMDCCVNLIAEAESKCVRREKSERSSISERKIQNRGDHLADCCEYASAELRWMVDNRETY